MHFPWKIAYVEGQNGNPGQKAGHFRRGYGILRTGWTPAKSNYPTRLTGKSGSWWNAFRPPLRNRPGELTCVHTSNVVPLSGRVRGKSRLSILPARSDNAILYAS